MVLASWASGQLEIQQCSSYVWRNTFGYYSGRKLSTRPAIRYRFGRVGMLSAPVIAEDKSKGARKEPVGAFSKQGGVAGNKTALQRLATMPVVLAVQVSSAVTSAAKSLTSLASVKVCGLF